MSKPTVKKLKVSRETLRTLGFADLAKVPAAAAANNTFLCPVSMTGYTCR